MSKPAIARMASATTTNTPATLPESEKKPPPELFRDRSGSAGGAVGVIVSVLTCPVTVTTEVTGVGVHVEDEDGDGDEDDEECDSVEDWEVVESEMTGNTTVSDVVDVAIEVEDDEATTGLDWGSGVDEVVDV